MTAEFRRGACPTLKAPMLTGDGLLARLNPVAGGLPPKSLIGLCESALRHGNGIVEITARGSLQIRGLTAESAALLATEVDLLGIAVRYGIAVEAGALAGLDPHEIADPRPLVERIGAAAEAAGLPGRLGPKVSVVVDGGGCLPMDGVTADVRLAATRSNAGARWIVTVAGEDGGERAVTTAGDDEARDIAIAALRMVAEKGREAHTRDLNQRQLASLAAWCFTSFVAALPNNGRTGQIPIEGAPREGPKSGAKAPIGIFDVVGGHALGIGLPFGSVPAGTLADLAGKALAMGANEIRFAPGRALLFLGLATPALPALREEAVRLGFLTDATDPRARIAACPGMPACASGRIATRELAEAVASGSADLFDGSFILHVSGCAKGCAHPGPTALAVVGGENGAGLVVDGTAKALPAGYRPRYDAARGIGRVTALIGRARHPGETVAACLARLGAAGIAEAYRQE